MTPTDDPDDVRPTVMLLHSSGMNARQWRRLAEALGTSHRVLTPDFLGSGANPPWPAEQSFHFDRDVERIVAQIEALTEPVHLGGHSYGGLIALQVARRIPARIASLFVYDPVAFGVLHAAGDQQGLADLARAEHNEVFNDVALGGSDAWFEVFVDYWNGVGAWRALPAESRASFLQVGRKVFWEVYSLMHDHTPASAYATITAPVLLLGGARSPQAAQRVLALLNDALPDATLHRIDGAGHMGPLTHATLMNSAVIQHIERAQRH